MYYVTWKFNIVFDVNSVFAKYGNEHAPHILLGLRIEKIDLDRILLYVNRNILVMYTIYYFKKCIE